MKRALIIIAIILLIAAVVGIVLLGGLMMNNYAETGSVFGSNPDISGGFWDKLFGKNEPEVPEDWQELVNEENFKFEELSDGTIGVKLIYDDGSDVLVIPEEYNGKPVSEVLYTKARLNAKAKKLIIPDSVTTIKEGAFGEFLALEEVIIGNGLKIIPDGIFRNSASLTSVTIGNSVTKIGYHAFLGCTSLTDIVIPRNVKLIDDEVFLRCNSLVNIFVDDGNAWYSDVNGVLFSKDASALIQYPMAKPESVYVVPSTVKEIKSHSFDGARYLTDVELHDDIVKIGVEAFSNTKMINDPKNVFNGVVYIDNYLISVEDKDITFCVIRTGTKIVADGALGVAKKIERIVFCDGLTHIGNYAVYNCSKLIKVYFPKSLVSIGDGAFENCPFSDGIYYAGFSRDKEKIRIGALNYYLEKRSWYFNRTSNDVIYHIWETTVIKAANCTETGLKKMTCSFCLEEKYAELPVDDSHHVNEVWTRISDSTCTERGIEESVCTLCGALVTRELASVSHKYGAWEVSADYSCDIGKVKTRTCSVCSHVEQVVSDVKEHIWGEQKILRHPTDKEVGMAVSFCTVCGVVQSTEIPTVALDEKDNLIGTVVGIAVTSLVVIGSVITTVILIRKKKRKS
jgi:hypothetical protein